MPNRFKKRGFPRGPFCADAENCELALSELLRNIEPVGNMRYVRHLTALKMKFQGLSGTVRLQLTEKQLSSMLFALRKWSGDRDRQKPKLRLIGGGNV